MVRIANYPISMFENDPNNEHIPYKQLDDNPRMRTCIPTRKEASIG